jgi:hypothetical protein
MHKPDTVPFSRLELDGQHTAQLPPRDLLIGVSVLGIPLAGVSDVGVTINTSGPNWLFGSVGSLA